MTAAEIERDALTKIRKIVRDEALRDLTDHDTKRIAAVLRDIAFQAEVAAQEIEGMKQ